MKRLAILDFDGTIVDSAATIEQALVQTLEHIGRCLPPPQCCRQVIGLSLLEAAAELMPGANAGTIAQFAEAFKTVFREARSGRAHAEPLFEGMRDLLDDLKNDGWSLAIATGNTRQGVVPVLEAHDLGGLFISLQTADEHPSKPNPSMVIRAMAEAGAAPSSTLVIGDTTFDMRMARAAGARAIGVAWGCHEAQDLVTAGASAVAHHPSDLLEIAAVPGPGATPLQSGCVACR